MPKTLYICYFGLREPLVQTQVLPYLRELVKGGYGVSLLTFEREAADLRGGEAEELMQKLANEGIDWHWLRYHKRLSAAATAWDIICGAWFVSRFIARERPDILHGRVHVPTLMGAIARKFTRYKPKLLFDIRGFFPEEYTDAGIWPENGLLYRGAKRVERWLMNESDGFVVLTEKARQILFPESKASGHDKQRRPVEVIPCCVDLKSRFSGLGPTTRHLVRKRLNIEGRFVLTHVGALGGLYLSEEIADFVSTALTENPKTFAMFLTQSDPNKIVPLLEKRGLRRDDYVVSHVPPAEIPDYLVASDVGLSFVRATFATQSRSPTKIPEYLACGLPIVANAGVGDVDVLIDGNRIGVLVDDFSPAAYRASIKTVQKLNKIGEACREIARREFDLESVGGVRYRRIYDRLLARN